MMKKKEESGLQRRPIREREEAMRERLIKEMSRAMDRPMLLLSQRIFWDGWLAG